MILITKANASIHLIYHLMPLVFEKEKLLYSEAPEKQSRYDTFEGFIMF